MKRTIPARSGTRCRGCDYLGPAGTCLDPVLARGQKSGRCGDWIWYMLGSHQHRRRYAKPQDPRTRPQRRSRARFAAASRKYSASLTDPQQDACIAAGAKLKCRPRLGPSGYLTGQQYLIRRELARKARARRQKAKLASQLAKLEALTKMAKSQVPQPQPLTRPTSGPHRLATGRTPVTHAPHTRHPRGILRSRHRDRSRSKAGSRRPFR